LLDHIDILKDLYGRVIIPEAVWRELQAAKTPAVVVRWISHPPSWLEVRKVSVPNDPALMELDAGEREAIVLAEMLKADAVILDDKAARREAERRHLPVIGTVRVLDDAAVAGLLNLPETLEQLRDAGFYLDPKLVQFLLDGQSRRANGKR
jgi:predicted nucleic acid-binding protein